MDERRKILECLECLRADIENQDTRAVMSFEEFLKLARTDPQRVLRNIFQLFYDMVISPHSPYRVIEKEDEYPGDPESIGFVEYDCSKIFSVGRDNPFFPDRLLANRFAKQVRDLKQGAQQNSMHVYEGPPGCGKSTFLNNLLQTFEEYTNTNEGQAFEIIWEIEVESERVEISCPNHDHPVLIIPKKHRVDFLDKLLSQQAAEIRHKFANEKEYQWLFEAEACTICQFLFWELCKKYGSFDGVLDAIKVRPCQFNRRVGEGISVFNPGDKPPPPKEIHLGDKQIQEKLDQIFGVNRVKYVFSPLAKTNNGIYVLMDIKSHNEERLLELHNVISEGVHKVNGVEERINSLFLALMNPEDREILKKGESFEQRIKPCKISYVMEVPTEVKIYRSIFGKDVDAYFLPRVLENFARVIISSRMNRKYQEAEALKEWIPEARLQQYSKKHYCDEQGLLLRMEIYGGVIPPWLSEGDRKKFTAPIRRNLIAEAEKEGDKGFSGRDSIRLFSDFRSLYMPKPNESKFNLITMANVADFFKNKIGKNTRDENIPSNFIDPLVDWYDYTVLNEVKEALYFYNEKQIREHILHYLCAINYDPDGSRIKCKYTDKEIEVTVEFFKMMAAYLTGEELSDNEAREYAQDVQRKYAKIIAQDPGKKITETELYQELFNSYVRNLKEKVLQPFLENKSFREVVKSFGTEEFKTLADTRAREHVAYMIKNVDKFGYTEQGAKEICLYVLDQGIAEKFS